MVIAIDATQATVMYVSLCAAEVPRVAVMAKAQAAECQSVCGTEHPDPRR
ncbi:hypothetical protein [Nocardia testacea]